MNAGEYSLGGSVWWLVIIVPAGFWFFVVQPIGVWWYRRKKERTDLREK